MGSQLDTTTRFKALLTDHRVGNDGSDGSGKSLRRSYYAGLYTIFPRKERADLPDTIYMLLRQSFIRQTYFTCPNLKLARLIRERIRPMMKKDGMQSQG